jgi:hypothetical protein
MEMCIGLGGGGSGCTKCMCEIIGGLTAMGSIIKYFGM